MRPAGYLAAILPFIFAASSASASPNRHRLGRAIPPPLRADDFQVQQPVLDSPGPAMPPSDQGPSGNPPTDPPAGGPGTVILSDVIGRDRSINIFAGLVRDVESVSRRLDNQKQNSTVLAPLNSAMEKLPRKPWEDPEDYNKLGADAYEGEDGWGRAQKNIRRFVEAHVIPQSPWAEGEKVRAVGSEDELWWEEKDGNKVVSCSCWRSPWSTSLTGCQIQPGDIEVTSVASSVENGQVVSYHSLACSSLHNIVWGLLTCNIAVDFERGQKLFINA